MNNRKQVLVTGGAGYIGSHTVLALVEAGYHPFVIDNFSNSSSESLRRVSAMVGSTIPWRYCDLTDKKSLDTLFKKYQFDAVIHFAGLKSVGESAEFPLKYYMNNVSGTLNLCECMEANSVRNLVFSSSATVYGEPESLPIREHFAMAASNPYGRSKLHLEEMLRDIAASKTDWNITLLRYFNPIGAHSSGCIGESPHGVPNNLLPYVAQVAIGKREKLRIFGGDYPTPDGTGVRDYIHVVDLAMGHIKALQAQHNSGLKTYNLGTGQGYSVLDIVQHFERISGHAVPYEVVSRRPGDVAECYADPTLAQSEMNWRAEFGLERMIEDCWRWQRNNPSGYDMESFSSQSA